MTDLLDKFGNRADGLGLEYTIVQLVQQASRKAVVTNCTALTDNTGGVSDGTVQGVAATLVNVADSGSQLADETTTTASLTQLLSNIADIVAKANAALVASGACAAAPVTDNAGGTVTGTMGAIPAVTAAATGAQASNLNTTLTAVNGYLYTAAQLVNRVARATGVAPVNIEMSAGSRDVDFSPTVTGVAFEATVPALAVNALGAAASPAVTQAAITAAFTRYAKDLAALAVVLNAAVAADPVPLVAVR